MKESTEACHWRDVLVSCDLKNHKFKRMTLQKIAQTLIRGTNLNHSRKLWRKSLVRLVEKVYPLTYTVPLRAKVSRSHHPTGHPLLATTNPVSTKIRVISLTISSMANLLILILTLILIFNYLKITYSAQQTRSSHRTLCYYTYLLLILSCRAMNPPLRRINSNKEDHSTITTTKKSIDHLHHH